MPTQVELVLGGFCLLLGVVWAARPAQMMRLQHKLLYFYLRNQDFDQTETQERIGRVSGAVLAGFGVLILLDVIP